MNNKLTIYKDNKIVEASYRLTLNEQRLVLACIGQVNSFEALAATNRFDVSVSDFSTLFGITEKRAYRELKSVINTLYERSITIMDERSVTGKATFRWISAKYHDLVKQTIGLRFSPDILPYLSKLESAFTKYQIQYVSGMKSVYSMRIYEMLVQWRTTKSVAITIASMRHQLQLDGKYPAFADIEA